MNYLRTVTAFAFLSAMAFAQSEDKAFLEKFEKTFEAIGNAGNRFIF